MDKKSHFFLVLLFIFVSGECTMHTEGIFREIIYTFTERGGGRAQQSKFVKSVLRCFFCKVFHFKRNKNCLACFSYTKMVSLLK